MRIPETCPLPAGSTVWGYLRRSREQQSEYSIAQQQAAAEAYCDRHNLVLARTFADEDRAGSSAENRDALNEMLDELRRRYSPIHDRRRRQEAAERRRFGVIVWSLARLGRDSVEATHIISDLRLRGLEVMSLSDDIVTGHTGLDQILEQLTFYKAQQDLTQLSRESKRGLHHVVSLRDTDPTFLAHNPGWEPTGRYLGVVPGNPPAGYRVERIVIGRRGGSKHEVQRLVPDPDTWERCRLAWQMRVERGATYREIHEATRLFSQNSVSNYGGLFRKRIYTGVYEFGGETYGSLPDDPFVEPLIPVAWFEQEAAAREARARARRKGGSRPPGLPDPRSSFGGRLLTGLVVCAR